MKSLILVILLFAVLINTSQALVLPQLPIDSPALITGKNRFVVYDAKLYKLGYKILLVNKNLVVAFQLVNAALKAKPKSIFWQERHAQLSQWLGYDSIALKAWGKVVEQQPTKINAYKQLVRLSQITFDREGILQAYQTAVKHGIDIEKIAPELLASLVNSSPEPESLLKFLELNQAKLPSAIEHIVQLQLQLGKFDQALHSLREAEKLVKQPSPANALMQAEILVMQNQPKAALTTLKKVQKFASNNNSEYWRFVSSLAWDDGDMNFAYKSYVKLYDADKINENNLLRLAWLSKIESPSKVGQYIYQAWKRFPNFNSLTQLVYHSFEKRNWNLMRNALQQATPDERKQLEQLPLYAIITAESAADRGDLNRASQIYSRALKHWPDSTELITAFFWYSIRSDQKPLIMYALRHYGNLPQLTVARVFAYIKIKRYKEAMQIYSTQLKQKANDIEWLLHYLDVARILHLKAESQRVIKHIMRVLKTEAKSLPASEVAITVAKLSSYKAMPATLQQHYLHLLAKQKGGKTAQELFLIWAVERRYYQIAFWQAASAQRLGVVLPNWIKLNLAMTANDKIAMQNLLTKTAGDLPHRDAVLAARRIQAIGLMQDLAYHGLAEHPEDSLAYQLFQESMIPYADYVGGGVAYRTIGGVSGPEAFAKANYVYSPTTTVHFSWHNWLTHVDREKIINVPQLLSTFKAAIFKKIKQGRLALQFGFRHALRNFPMFIMGWEDRLTHSLSYMITGGLYESVDDGNLDSTLLQIGGYQHQLKLQVDYRLNTRDSLVSSLSQGFLFGQDHVYLGNVQRFDLNFTHLFTLAYPDWNITPTFSLYRYHSKGPRQSIIQDLIPDAGGVPVDVVPRSFWQIGTSFGFGQQYFTEYTHSWKPFAQVTAVYNSVDEIIASVFAGVTTMVFGRDHLVLYGDLSKNFQQEGETNAIVGIRYKHYF